MIDNLKTALFVLVKPKQAFSQAGEGGIGLWLAAAGLVAVVLVLKPVFTAPVMRAESQKAIRAELKRLEAEEAKGKVPPMPADQKEQMKNAMKAGSSSGFLMISGVFQALGLFAGTALSALAILGLVKLFKGSLNYASALAVIGLAFMPYFVGEIVKTSATLLTGNLATSQGLASLMRPAGPSGAWPAMDGPGEILAFLTLSRIDIFVIWSLVLLAVGVAATAGLGRAKGAALSGIYWALAWALVAVPAAGSMLLLAPMMSSSAGSGP